MKLRNDSTYLFTYLLERDWNFLVYCDTIHDTAIMYLWRGLDIFYFEINSYDYGIAAKLSCSHVIPLTDFLL